VQFIVRDFVAIAIYGPHVQRADALSPFLLLSLPHDEQDGGHLLVLRQLDHGGEEEEGDADSLSSSCVT
jgi:hypothetical protein